MVDRPLDWLKGLHDNLPGQELKLLIITLKFPWFVRKEGVQLLLAQALDPLLNPLAPHFRADPVVEVLNQLLLRAV